MTSPLRLTIDPRGVATLTLATAEKHNVLSQGMIDALSQAAREIATNATIRAVILTGEGASFCAGGDLGWMRQQMSATRPERINAARSLADMLYLLNTLPKPLIGRVQGNAFGGGIGMMSVCDCVVAVESAKFGLTETKLGLIPATISPYVLARMGEGMARRVFLSARLFGAIEARDLGLVGRIVAADALDDAVEAEVKPYLATAPGAVAAAKALARSLGPVIDEEVIARTIEHLADTWENPEASEGISAFFEKRPATWIKPV